MSFDTVTRLFTSSSGEIQCCTCGLSFVVPISWKEHRVKQRNTFWCPNGHLQSFIGRTEEQRLRDELAHERHRREQAEAGRDHAEHRRRGTLGALRKTQKRIKNGVCPCCHRTFGNVARHMATQHPAFASQSPEA